MAPLSGDRARDYTAGMGVPGEGSRPRLRLVTSQVLSFEQLVRIEHALRALPAVRRVRLEEFRQGTALYRVTLRAPLDPHEFAARLSQGKGVRFALDAVRRGGIELRVERELAPDLADAFQHELGWPAMSP